MPKGPIEIFEDDDPEIQVLVEATRQAFGPSAKAMTIKEFRWRARGEQPKPHAWTCG